MMAATGSWYGFYSGPKVRVSITGECNLNCFYCKPLGNDSFMTGVKWALMPSDITRFARSLAEKGISNIEISGCEPLLRKDASSFIKAICSVKQIKELSLRTNGTFLKNHADSLRKAGLKKLEISLSSLNFVKYQKITGRDNLYRILDGLEKAERLKFSDLIINVLVLNGVNSDELIDFAMLTKKRAVHVRFIEYHPVIQDIMAPHDKLNLSILHIKRAIDGFQKLFPYEDEIDFDGPQRFRFRDGIGFVSFMNQSDLQKVRSIPTIMLNSIGEIRNSIVPNKSINILKELRRDSKDDVLSKTIDKQISLTMGKRKPQVQPKGRPSLRRAHQKEARA